MWFFFSKRSRQTGDSSQNWARSLCHQQSSGSLWEVCGWAERLAEAFEGVRFSLFYFIDNSCHCNINNIKSFELFRISESVASQNDSLFQSLIWSSVSKAPIASNTLSNKVLQINLIKSYIFYFGFLLLILSTGSRRFFPGGWTRCPSPQEQHPSAHAQKRPTSSSARVFPVFSVSFPTISQWNVVLFSLLHH